MIQLPFTGDPSDPFFRWASEMLYEHQIKISSAMLRVYYQRACDDFRQTADHFGAFWERFNQDDVICLLSPEKSFFDVVLQKVGVRIEEAPPEILKRRDDLWQVRIIHHKVAVAMGHLFNMMIHSLRRDDLDWSNPAFSSQRIK